MARIENEECRILMFSAGLDSFIMKREFGFKNEECCFVRMGTRENIQEEKLIDKHFPGVIKLNLPLLSQFELENKIIPHRNAILALLAANLASNIYFAFTGGDTTRDKDYVFKSQIEGIMNYFAGIPEKVPFAGPYFIHIPYKQYSKTEIVKNFLIDLNNTGAELIHISRSCYAGGSKPCGVCRSCIRKFVALTNNGIDCMDAFEINPMEGLQSFYIESVRKKRHNEIQDIEKCIQIVQQ